MGAFKKFALGTGVALAIGYGGYKTVEFQADENRMLDATDCYNAKDQGFSPTASCEKIMGQISLSELHAHQDLGVYLTLGTIAAGMVVIAPLAWNVLNQGSYRRSYYQ